MTQKNVKCVTDSAVTGGLFLIILKYSNTDLGSVCVEDYSRFVSLFCVLQPLLHI